jgi:hypothetical protein
MSLIDEVRGQLPQWRGLAVPMACRCAVRAVRAQRVALRPQHPHNNPPQANRNLEGSIAAATVGNRQLSRLLAALRCALRPCMAPTRPLRHRPPHHLQAMDSSCGRWRGLALAHRSLLMPRNIRATPGSLRPLQIRRPQAWRAPCRRAAPRQVRQRERQPPPGAGLERRHCLPTEAVGWRRQLAAAAAPPARRRRAPRRSNRGSSISQAKGARARRSSPQVAIQWHRHCRRSCPAASPSCSAGTRDSSRPWGQRLPAAAAAAAAAGAASVVEAPSPAHQR